MCNTLCFSVGKWEEWLLRAKQIACPSTLEEAPEIKDYDRVYDLCLFGNRCPETQANLCMLVLGEGAS